MNCSDDANDDNGIEAPKSSVCGQYAASPITENTWIETESQLRHLHESGCTEIRSSLRLYFLPGVTDLTYLENLEKVRTDIEIGYTSDLKSLDGLEGLKRYQSMRLVQNESLEDTSALQVPLEGERQNYFSLYLAGNDSLRAFEGLEGISHVPGLTIVANPQLESISGLEDAYSDPAFDDFVRMRVERNPNLPTCEVTKLLERVDEDQYIAVIEGNDDGATCP
jgi:hypothetical protein